MKNHRGEIMKKISKFLRTTFLGGILVILPIVLTFIVLRWIFNFVLSQVKPLTILIIKQTNSREFIAYSSAVIIIIGIFFLTGLAIRTRIGKFLFSKFEKNILDIAPGYSLFKETLKQLLGKDKRPFSSVVLAKVFESETLMTGFVADETSDRVTVFFPSALNPTTGLLCHLRKEDVTRIDTTVETAMRTIIGCGAGASQLFKNI